MEEEYIRGLLAGLTCPECGRHYDPTTTSSLGCIEGSWVFYVYCPSCNSLGFAIASAESDATTEVDNDLSPTERDELTALVTTDDVIDMHVFLKSFDGGFLSLFAGG